ncbi:aldo/keto reductase [Azotosporobacter soli]|uniref:aldo/keto reductase n=1 Tax=Azotosporobacter soli TaxID=3055040 RepID=UPI0031FF353E
MTKLCLGTVQFGMDYGINNQQGKPSVEKVFAMIDHALASGITCIDTACAYGDAEMLLGQYGISKHDVKVITKLKPNLITEKCADPAKKVTEEMIGALERMHLSVLDGYLLHTPEDFYNAGIVEGLLQGKKRGLVKNIGVSVYEMKHAMDVVESGIMDYIQLPYSILDQRADQDLFFKRAKENGVTIFARSAFLQGFLLMEEKFIPQHLEDAKVYLREFDTVIKKYGFTRSQAAFLFAYKNENIDYLVFGVDNLQQLGSNIEMCKERLDFSDCRKELSNHFSGISKNIIFPSLWKRG